MKQIAVNAEFINLISRKTPVSTTFFFSGQPMFSNGFNGGNAQLHYTTNASNVMLVPSQFYTENCKL